ncbi:DNA repair protein complementing XP-A cells-like protein [Leptotrombidium deliense]|uniref:DNA repair protein complementing XP-A cells-like protein n=1 Tax=Leptotrombidium deliense TaxID=299467 RepID=A0A443S8G2_9ACAR|nr:DNA repair protein complementing XP-A cells-like protein [Leptotrombidium deliense]
MSSESDNTEVSPRVLTAEQKARIERNRQRALLIRQQKQVKLSTRELNKSLNVDSKVGSDTGAGFIIEEDNCVPSTSAENAETSTSQDFVCDECGGEFSNSFLKKKYNVNVCYKCSKDDPHYELITRTETKNEYLLKDCDLDKREPPLKFVLKKNPNPLARGEMKLYLRAQVEERALEVWESEEGLEEERNRRVEKRHQRQEKQYQKRMKDLRMSTRSSLYLKKSVTHEHEFGEEVYKEESDTYEKVCKTCNHVISYEKM